MISDWSSNGANIFAALFLTRYESSRLRLSRSWYTRTRSCIYQRSSTTAKSLLTRRIELCCIESQQYTPGRFCFAESGIIDHIDKVKVGVQYEAAKGG